MRSKGGSSGSFEFFFLFFFPSASLAILYESRCRQACPRRCLGICPPWTSRTPKADTSFANPISLFFSCSPPSCLFAPFARGPPCNISGAKEILEVTQSPQSLTAVRLNRNACAVERRFRTAMAIRDMDGGWRPRNSNFWPRTPLQLICRSEATW